MGGSSARRTGLVKTFFRSMTSSVSRLGRQCLLRFSREGDQPALKDGTGEDIVSQAEKGELARGTSRGRCRVLRPYLPVPQEFVEVHESSETRLPRIFSASFSFEKKSEGQEEKKARSPCHRRRVTVEEAPESSKMNPTFWLKEIDVQREELVMSSPFFAVCLHSSRRMLGMEEQSSIKVRTRSQSSSRPRTSMLQPNRSR